MMKNEVLTKILRIVSNVNSSRVQIAARLMDINYFLSRLCATMNRNKLAGKARSDFDLKRIFHHSGRWSMNPSHSPCLLIFVVMECDGLECKEDSRWDCFAGTAVG